MNTCAMNPVLKNPGPAWSSPLGCEDHGTTAGRAVLRTSEDHSGPQVRTPRKHKDALVLTTVLGCLLPVLEDWSSAWSSVGHLSGPSTRPADRQPDPRGTAAARICRRAAALYERRARKVLGRSRHVRRSVSGLALLVVPFVAVQRWLLVRDASSNPPSAQVSGSALALCHKTAHNAAEIGAKSARRGFSAADRLGGGHCA